MARLSTMAPKSLFVASSSKFQSLPRSETSNDRCNISCRARAPARLRRRNIEEEMAVVAPDYNYLVERHPKVKILLENNKDLCTRLELQVRKLTVQQKGSRTKHTYEVTTYDECYKIQQQLDEMGKRHQLESLFSSGYDVKYNLMVQYYNLETPQYQPSIVSITVKANRLKSIIGVAAFTKTLRKGGTTSFPEEFCELYANMLRNVSLTLEDPNGKEKMIRCNKKNSTHYNNKELSGQWKVFVEQQNLALGDEMVFHLVGQSKFKVYIFRQHDSTKCTTPGHFGYIELPIKIYHPLWISDLRVILSLICLKCLKLKKKGSRDMLEIASAVCCVEASQVTVCENSNFLELKLPSETEVSNGAWDFLDRFQFADGCTQTTRPLLASEVLEILKKVSRETIKDIHNIRKISLFFHEGYIMQHLPVPPNCMSTPDAADASDGVSVSSLDNSTATLKEVLKQVEIIQRLQSVPDFEPSENLVNRLQSAIKRYLQSKSRHAETGDVEPCLKDVGPSGSSSSLGKKDDNESGLVAKSGSEAERVSGDWVQKVSNLGNEPAWSSKQSEPPVDQAESGWAQKAVTADESESAGKKNETSSENETEGISDYSMTIDEAGRVRSRARMPTGSQHLLAVGEMTTSLHLVNSQARMLTGLRHLAGGERTTLHQYGRMGCIQAKDAPGRVKSQARMPTGSRNLAGGERTTLHQDGRMGCTQAKDAQSTLRPKPKWRF